MKRSEFITVDSKGTFKLKNLQFPPTEIVGVFYQFQDLYNQNEYLQYVDPVTFGKGYGTVYTDALYTITTDTDGSNDQVIQVYPAPPSQLIGVEYYCDWPKLGDLTTSSKLQQVTLNINGVANQNGNINFSVTIDGVNLQTLYPITAGETAADVQQRILQNQDIKFQANPGNNISTWYATAIPNSTNVLLTSPSYISSVAAFGATSIGGIGAIPTVTQQPFIQTVQTNWFLYQYPYMYYYAALKHAYNGLEDLERYQLVEKDFQKAVTVFQQLTATAEWGGVHRQSDYNQNIIW